MYVPPEGIVYQHLAADGTVLYVGSTSRTMFRRRQLAHVNGSRWWRFVAHVEVWAILPTRRAALSVERALIREHAPVFNRVSHGLDDQEARERAYLGAHPDVPARRPLPRTLSPADRGAATRKLLARVGVS